MVALKRVMLAAIATVLLAGACTSISIPTIPPINVPGASGGITLPSFPPINLPGSSGGAVIPPIGLPVGSPSATPCQIVTAAEVSQIFGTQVLDQSDSSTDCTFNVSLTSAITVQATTDTDFSGVQFLLGNTAQQSTIAGFPAMSGTFFGQALLYVQKPSGQLQVLGILTGSDPATMDKLQQVATIAVGRMP